MKKLSFIIIPLIDLILVPFIIPSLLVLSRLRRSGISRYPLCKKLMFRIGIFPIRKHYYEPQFDHRAPLVPYTMERALPGVRLNEVGQLELLRKLTYANELKDLESPQDDRLTFKFGNKSFESGDAEYWYQIIRHYKPRRIIEIGSGNSTLMAIRAIEKNKRDDQNYSCTHICVEPYEQPWLEQTGVTVVRRKVEELPLSYFSDLESNDILFIDSSHIIRPQGDVVFEYLQVLPALKRGVIVHVHDIFTPRNYMQEWLTDHILFWNEQFLLEAFLTHNDSWEIIGAINYLHHHHFEALKKVAPFLVETRDPVSFYIRKL